MWKQIKEMFIGGSIVLSTAFITYFLTLSSVEAVVTRHAQVIDSLLAVCQHSDTVKLQLQTQISEQSAALVRLASLIDSVEAKADKVQTVTVQPQKYYTQAKTSIINAVTDNDKKELDLTTWSDDQDNAKKPSKSWKKYLPHADAVENIGNQLSEIGKLYFNIGNDE